MKPVLVASLVISLIVSFSFLQLATADAEPSLCDSKCAARCADAGVKKRCLTYCGICCQKCSCVPSGTIGNKSECPCYRDMLNSKGKSKCP